MSDRRALGAICTAQFMLILDLTVVNVALPDLGAELGSSRVAFTWAVSAYGLVFGGLMLLGGRLADRYGSRTMMLTGLAVFTLASFACGVAQDEALLIAARAGQGAGAALLSPAALRAITTIFDGAARTKALSVWASLGGLGFTAGVLIGGLLTSGPGWRWVFIVNVPVGAALLAAVWSLVPAGHRPATARVDVLGAVTVTTATGSLIYGMINAGDHGWADPATLAPVAASVVLYGGFAFVERTTRHPLPRPRILARRTVATGSFLMFFAAGVLIADLFLTSQYLQHLRGLSALETGLFFLPAAVALMAGAIAAGRLVGRVGTRAVAVTALGLVTVANAYLIGVSADGDLLVEVLPAMVLYALGGGPLFVSATTSALGRAGPHDAGLISGVVQTFNQLGAAICVAVASTVAAAGLTATPSVDGFTTAFAVFAAVAAVAAAVAVAARLGLTGVAAMDVNAVCTGFLYAAACGAGLIAAGVAGLVLERAADARARHARVRAHLTGFGASADAHHATRPDPAGTGVRQAIDMALADACLAPGDIDHVNAHGTATRLNDLAEATVVAGVFGPRPAVTSVKGVTGHSLGAAGAIEAACTVLTVQHGVVPPTANLDRRDPEIDMDVVTGAPRVTPVVAAVSNSFGFGGQNAVLVMTAA